MYNTEYRECAVNSSEPQVDADEKDEASEIYLKGERSQAFGGRSRGDDGVYGCMN